MISSAFITSSASLWAQLSQQCPQMNLISEKFPLAWLHRTSRPLAHLRQNPHSKARHWGYLGDTTLIQGIDGNLRRVCVLFCFPGILSTGKGSPLLSWLVLTHPAMPSLQTIPCPSTERVSEVWLQGRLGFFTL